MMHPSRLLPLTPTKSAERKRAIASFVACAVVDLDDGRCFVLRVPLPAGFRVPAEIIGKLPPWLARSALKVSRNSRR